MNIGNKLRELRMEKGLTQEELADRAELSKGFISQIERDLTSPSIATLVDLLQCLGTNLKDFFSDDSDEQIVFPKEDFFEKTDAELLNTIEWIIPNAQKNMMEPIRVTLLPGGSTYPDRPHEGEEFGYVLQGVIHIHLGQRVYTAKKGETFYFTPNCEHSISAGKKDWCKIYLGKHTTQFLIISNCFHVQNIYLTKRRRSEHMANKLIDIVNVSKSYGDNLVLDELNLYIRENEFLTLLGPSGCGKTTLLRILGGFESCDSGHIIFDGKNINNVPPNKRQLNTVFQKYALFSHMSIAENIAFGLKIKGKSKAYINDKIRYALKLVNLDGYENRTPDSLSGGQQQRIAIARAIVNEPKVLLLDEPLGALDLKLRQDMQYELIRLKNELGITFIYVTHDQEEALTMSDTIVVMNQGYIQQIGTPEDIYNEPENAFVADFIGESNILPAVMVEDKLVKILGVNFPCVDVGFGKNKPVDAVIRPEDIDLVKPEEGLLEGVVTHLIFKGVHYEMEVSANNFDWLVHSTDMVPVGTTVGIKVDPFDIQIMKKPESEDEEAVPVEE